MCLILTPKEATTVTWTIMKYPWIDANLLVNCTRQMMTCEPIDIVYFILGTGNLKF